MRLEEKVRLCGGELLLGALWGFKYFSKVTLLRNVYRYFIIQLVKRTKLFDPNYYLNNNVDVADSDIPPLTHYIGYGDQEGRCPLPVFNPQYYRSRVQGETKHVNALLHYAYIGRYRRISPSPWFDLDYYLMHNKDVVREGCEPIYHYLTWGGTEGRSPNPQFDGAYYLRQNPEVAVAGLNPLLHYLHTGRYNNVSTRLLNVVAGLDNDTSIGCNITADMWKAIVAKPEVEAPKVDVVLPVYRNTQLTLRCIYSILTSQIEIPYELIVINDASPEPELLSELHVLSEQKLFTLLHNKNNLGFVATANRGMALHPDRDVVLINSDTEVYNNWLDRLNNAAYRYDHVGSITPLSNNATICSYPHFLHDNPYSLEMNYALLDKNTAKVNSGVTVEAPTGVGFCMYITRDALKRVGLFDAETFGKGYGEENDWCQRAIKQGWKNLITADTFVRHFGSASFQEEKSGRMAMAMKALNKKHKKYHESVQEFIADDPLLQARCNLDWARLRARKQKENTLIVCHNRGGGSERHVQEDTQLLKQRGQGVYYLRPEPGHLTDVRICHPTCQQLLNIPAFSLNETAVLATALKELGISVIHSHGLVDFSSKAPEQLLKLANDMNVPLHVDIHDYKVICPRINLVDNEGMYCGEPDAAACNNCLIKHGNDFGVTNIIDWRDSHYRVLRAAERIWVPDQDVATRLNRYYPDLSLTVAPHGDIDPSKIIIQHPHIKEGEKLRIVLIGAISKIKGYNVLLSCAEDVKNRNLPLEFIVMGYSINDSLLKQSGINVTGLYVDSEAQNILHQLNAHVVWLPSILIASRLRGIGECSGLLPYSKADNKKHINNYFNKYRSSRIVTSMD